ncbi:MAG: glyoxalase [Bernardetiaceae bacterium]|nr:glyoxalase [Bernardetiaceae bacterium]
MDEHDERRLQIRPQLALETPAAAGLEQFQSETLRPVLKMQNRLILGLFDAYLAATKTDLRHRSPEQRRQLIDQALAKDQALKHQLVGVVVGQFTQPELAFFVQHRSELTKRLAQFLAKRIADQWPWE